jgi:hypothetical protein
MKLALYFICRHRVLGLAILSGLLIPQANALVCAGKIGYLGIDQVGQVAVSNGAGINTICNSTTQNSFQITPPACRMFYATLLANRLAGRSVSLYYNDPAMTSCAQIGTWTTQPSAYFVEQSD